jgi:hypothetical protein
VVTALSFFMAASSDLPQPIKDRTVAAIASRSRLLFRSNFMTFLLKKIGSDNKALSEPILFYQRLRV